MDALRLFVPVDCGPIDHVLVDEAPDFGPNTYVGMTRAKERLVLTATGNHLYIANLEGGSAAPPAPGVGRRSHLRE